MYMKNEIARFAESFKIGTIEYKDMITPVYNTLFCLNKKIKLR